VDANLLRGWLPNRRLGRVCGSILKNSLVGFCDRKMHFSQISHPAVTKRVTGVQFNTPITSTKASNLETLVFNESQGCVST
jgi:hypothetical protein